MNTKEKDLSITQKDSDEKISKSEKARRELDDQTSVMEKVVIQGDLAKLSPQDRITYYHALCRSTGLNPFTRPFEYMVLKGKMVLYAKKDCTEQLRKIHGVSVVDMESTIRDDILVTKVKVQDASGRTDIAMGAVCLSHTTGESKANLYMKAETKAKRRATLSICGLGITDESEISSIPDAKPIDMNFDTGELLESENSNNRKENLIEQKINSEEKENNPRTVESVESVETVEELKSLILNCDKPFQIWVYDSMQKIYGIDQLVKLNSKSKENLINICKNRIKELQSTNLNQQSE